MTGDSGGEKEGKLRREGGKTEERRREKRGERKVVSEYHELSENPINTASLTKGLSFNGLFFWKFWYCWQS